MARIVLDLPLHFALDTGVRVCISHVNQVERLDDAQLPSLVPLARVLAPLRGAMPQAGAAA